MKRILLGLLALILVTTAALFAWGYQADRDPAAMRAKYTSPASQFVALEPGLSVHVRDEGVPGAPVLVLIHGSNSSLHTWEPWVERLKSLYRVVSLDLPGHGLTGPHPQRDYSAAAFVSVVDRTMSKLGVPAFALAGNSMGGWVAWNYALAHPQRLTALVLVDAAGAPTTRPKSIPIGFRVVQSPIGRALGQYITPRSLIEQSLEQSVAIKPIVNDPMVERYWDLLLYPGNRAATGDRARAKRIPATREQMARIATPTLVMWGAEDSLIPVSAADWFATAIPGARKIVYPAIGHIPMEEAPDRSARDLEQFLGLAASDARLETVAEARQR